MVKLEPNGSYSIDIRINNKRVRERGFVTRDAANDYVNDLKTSKRYAKLGLTNPNAKKVTTKPDIKLTDLFDKRLADLHHRQTIATLKRCKELLLSITGDVNVTDLTFQHLKEFVRRRGKQVTQYDRPVTPSTVFREMTEISSMLNKAGEYFHELESYQPPKMPRPKLDKTRRERIITPKERDAILEQLNRPREKGETEFQYDGRRLTALCLEFALLTASRRKEIVRLKRSDYVPELDKLKIKRWKTIKSKADSVSIFSPVPERVKEILEQRKLDSTDKVYLFSIDGHDDQQYLDDMAEACVLAHIPYGKYTEGGLVFHDARHTFITNLLQEGVDLETVRELAGLSREMILRYAHSSPESKQKAARIIDKWARNGQGDFSNVRIL